MYSIPKQQQQQQKKKKESETEFVSNELLVSFPRREVLLVKIVKQGRNLMGTPAPHTYV